jgi:hypothetical protein
MPPTATDNAEERRERIRRLLDAAQRLRDHAEQTRRTARQVLDRVYPPRKSIAAPHRLNLSRQIE